MTAYAVPTMNFGSFTRGAAYSVLEMHDDHMRIVDDVGQVNNVGFTGWRLIHSWHVMYGRVFTLSHVTFDHREANEWLERNPGHGVLAVVGSEVRIASMDDHGIPLAPRA